MTREQLTSSPPPPQPRLKMPGPNDFVGILDAQRQERGDAFDISLGDDKRAVVLSHPEDIRYVLNDSNYEQKAEPIYRGPIKVLGESSLTLSGTAWREVRAATNPIFHPKSVRDMTPTIVAIGSNFARELGERYDGQPVDALKAMNDLARQTLRGTLFGRHANALKELDVTLDAAFELVTPARKEMDEATQRHFDSVTSQLRKGTKNILDNARQTDPDGSLPSRLAYSNLTDEAAISEQNTIMFAGQETTALALTWLLDTVQNYPAVVERMQDEIDTVLGGRPSEYLNIADLTYIPQVISEGLRLRPPVPVIARVAKEADTFNGITINAGNIVFIHKLGAHRHPEYWNDPHDFNPDRFASKPAEYSYIPFSLGKRMCIGRGLALSELAIHTVSLFSNLDIQVTSEQATPKFDTTLVPGTPVEATFRPLDAAA